jgi:hypothetical protein
MARQPALDQGIFGRTQALHLDFLIGFVIEALLGSRLIQRQRQAPLQAHVDGQLFGLASKLSHDGDHPPE